jgi:hypothetical protein
MTSEDWDDEGVTLPWTSIVVMPPGAAMSFAAPGG